MKSHLDRLRFRHLLLIESLGATSSLRKTAERLDMTQPGCSKLLRELETELGAVLFERTTAGVTPTAFGEIMIRAARTMLMQANAALDEIEMLSQGTRVRLRLGMFGVALSRFVAEVVKRMREVAPRSVIALEEGSAELLLAALAHGELDCVMGRGRQTVNSQGLRQIPLFFEPVRLVVRRDHPMSKRKRIPLAELVEFEWMLPAPGTVLRQRIESLLKQHCLPMPRCFVESSVYMTNQALLPMSDQISLFPQRLAEALASERALTVLDAEFPLELPPVTLWLRDASVSPALNSLVIEIKRISEKWA